MQLFDPLGQGGDSKKRVRITTGTRAWLLRTWFLRAFFLMFLLLLSPLTSRSECRRPHGWWGSVPQFLHEVITFSILLLSFLPLSLPLQLPWLFCSRRGLVIFPQSLGQPSDALCSSLYAYTCHLAWTSDNGRHRYRSSTPFVAWHRLQDLGDSSTLPCIQPSNPLKSHLWQHPEHIHMQSITVSCSHATLIAPSLTEVEGCLESLVGFTSPPFKELILDG